MRQKLPRKQSRGEKRKRVGEGEHPWRRGRTRERESREWAS